MATKIRPLHDRVIVKRLEEEEKSKGGIIIRTQPRKNYKRVA
jgi:chaperonin GroES